MAKQIEGVYERILACAKEEFLEKGFKDASLRVIAANANTSTGSIYTRFHDKQGLFQQIVEPVVEGMMEMYLRIQETFSQMDSEVQIENMGSYTSASMDDMIDYMYDHFDEFCLLLDASYGTRFQNFMEEMIRIEVEYTYKYMKHIDCQSISSGEVTEEFFHIVVTSYFNSVFEVIRHRMSREEAKRYIHLLNKYHMAGCDTIFYPEKYE